jgi:hypothetical protein
MTKRHSGYAIYTAVREIIIEWNLGGRIASITLDNASANSKFIEHLSKDKVLNFDETRLSVASRTF